MFQKNGFLNLYGLEAGSERHRHNLKQKLNKNRFSKKRFSKFVSLGSGVGKTWAQKQSKITLEMLASFETELKALLCAMFDMKTGFLEKEV